MSRQAETAPGERIRFWLVSLVLLGCAGTVLELILLRHWSGVQELIPGILLALTGVAAGALMARPSRGTVLWARTAGWILAIAGAYGIGVHIYANYSSAPLDGVIGPQWETFGLLRRLYLASTGGVGPAPPLSAASITPTGLALVLSTMAHPAHGAKGALASRG